MLLRSIIFLSMLISSVVCAAELPGILGQFSSLDFFPGKKVSWELIEIHDADGDVVVKWRDKKGQEVEVTARKAAHRTVDTIYSALGAEVDTAVKAGGGNILVNESYFGVAVSNSGAGFLRLHILAGTPNAVYWWKYRTRSDNQAQLQLFSEKLTLLLREIQYKEVKSRGNVMMGGWSGPVQAYAILLAKTDVPRAEKVYQALLEVDSSNIEAHAEFMSIASNHEQVKASARIVRKYAESAVLIESAAKKLGQNFQSANSLKPLEKHSKNLRVVLLPLPPYNSWLLEEVADAYESITGLPVDIRKLPVPWDLQLPTRTRYRPVLERLASQLWPNIADFSDWPLEKLQNQIYEKAKQEGQASIANVKTLFEKVNNEGGQWEAAPLVDLLWQGVKPYAEDSPYTMYVGLTEADIYSKDTSFVFSSYGGYPTAPVSILSYARMASALTEENQSRKRLVERIAKELVPASLKRLGIPRSIDPSCPYSYANGLQRVDEKSLTLSDPTKKRLNDIQRQIENGI